MGEKNLFQCVGIPSHFFVLLGLLNLIVGQAWALAPQDIYRQADSQVLALELLDIKGVVISSHTALTLGQGKAVAQCDVLDSAASVRLIRGVNVYRAQVVYSDSASNLCLLNVPELASTPLSEWLQRDPDIGSRVYAVSNVIGFGISIAEGIVSGIRNARGETLIQFTAALSPGSEGGALYDAEGRLLGMILYRERDGQNVNIAIPARRLQEAEQRAASETTLTMWRGQAATLSREAKWADLMQHASAWSAAEPKSPDALLWLALAHEQVKAWPEAEQAYREAIKRDPEATGASVSLSIALMAQGKFPEAMEVARTTLLVWPDDARLWLVIGYAESSASRLEQAKQAFERATQLAAWNKNAYAALADIARAQGKWAEVVSALRQVVRIDAQDQSAWLQLAEAYLYTRRPQRALASAEQALALAPASGDALLFKGAALVSARRYQEGIPVLKHALALNPRRPDWVWSWLGSAYYDLQLFPEAINAYREGLKLQPASVDLKRSLGLALKDGLHLADALLLFEELKAAAPDDPFPWRQIGFVHAYLAQPDKAIPALVQSLTLDPKQIKVWLALMETYHAADRKAEMKHAYEKARALDSVTAERYSGLLLPYEGAP